MPEAVATTLTVMDPVRELARGLADSKAVLFLGRHVGYPIALEGALKLKELAYMHAEGFAAGELKHGPIALIEQGLPVVVTMPSPKFRPTLHAKMLSNIREIQARGARTIVIAEEFDDTVAPFADYLIELPRVPAMFQPLVATVPLQILAAEIARSRGYDIDKPRNLAKVGHGRIGPTMQSMGDDFLSRQRVLVISPHADDETYGCAGTIARIKHLGGQVFVNLVSVGSIDHYASTDHGPAMRRVTSQTRLREFSAVMKLLKVDDWDVMLTDDDLHLALDSVPRRELVRLIERDARLAIENVEPTLMLIPAFSYNQDHEALFRACVTATRPGVRDERHFVSHVLAYDNTSLFWSLEREKVPPQLLCRHHRILGPQVGGTPPARVADPAGRISRQPGESGTAVTAPWPGDLRGQRGRLHGAPDGLLMVACACISRTSTLGRSWWPRSSPATSTSSTTACNLSGPNTTTGSGSGPAAARCCCRFRSEMPSTASGCAMFGWCRMTTGVATTSGFSARRTAARPTSTKCSPSSVRCTRSHHTMLVEFTTDLISTILDYLGCRTRLVLASSLPHSGDNTDRLIQLTTGVGGDEHITSTWGTERRYIDWPRVADAGIKVRTQEFIQPRYRQQFEPFVPDLGVLDLLFAQGKSAFTTIAGSSNFPYAAI